MWAEDQIRDWLMEAAASTGCAVEMVPDAEEASIVAQLRGTYVNEMCDPGRWWEDLKLPYEYFNRSDRTLSEVMPSLEGSVYLLPEAPQFAFVYRLRATDVETVIMDCPGFEYAIASEDGSWLIVENHHDVFYRCLASDATFL